MKREMIVMAAFIALPTLWGVSVVAWEVFR